MCWIGKKEDRKIATEDIKTRKIVDKFNGRIHGYYQDWFEYKLGVEYKIGIVPNSDFLETIIDVGFHSYAWDVEMKSMCGGDIRVKSNRPNSGQTVFTNHRGFDGSHKIAVMECTIPKGTVYWENRVGEIVSEKLILEEEIYIEDDCNFC